MAAPTLNGRLEDEPLPLVLQRLFAAQATGVLTIEARAGRHEVYVREGFPVGVTLPGSAELIGKVLLEMGLLDQATYQRTLAAPPPKGLRYGDWLVEQQLVSGEQLRLALKAQVRRKLHRLFFLDEGQLAFAAGEHGKGLQGGESLRVHPARAIYQGVRSAWSAERLAGALFLLEGRALRLELDDPGVARYGVGKDDARVPELLRKGYWALADLVDAAGLSPQAVHALVYAFYVTEALDVKGLDEVTRLRKRADTPRSGVPAPPREVSGARPLPPPVPPPAPPAPRATANTSGSFPVPPASSDPDTMRKLIEAKAQVVEEESLFAVLGVSEAATTEQVKAAYFEAAKRFHPDRLGALGLEALRPQVEKIFRRVSEAHSTLADDARREEYKRNLAQPGESPEAHQKALRLLDAEMAFRRGETLVKKHDYAGAVRELDGAVKGDPQNGEYLAWLTWARVCAGTMSFPDARPRFAEATKLSPRCGRAFYFLGLALKEDKDLDRATAAFRKALDLDARLLDAEREIRLITMRKEKDKGGWFRKK